MDFTTVTLSRLPTDLPFAVEVKETPRKRKLVAELRYDPSLNRDGITGEGARWWLVLDERLRVGAMTRTQVWMLLEEWIAKGFQVRAEVVVEGVA
jgi:hypothetical protein